jgi:DNA-binding LacI/PurR family transcriptional regulator
MKFKGIADLLRRRIAAGDYAINTFPGEIQLSEEMGVSRKTIRRSLQMLIDEGLLVRAPSRRLVVNRQGNHPGARKLIGFLAPSFASLEIDQWRVAAEQVARKRNVLLRTVDYEHDEDPSITDALEGLDGVFVLLSSDSSRGVWHSRLSKHKAVVLNTNMSDADIVSVVLHPPRFIDILLDYLKDLGHRRIDCFNIQPIDSVITRRIAVWRDWCDRNGVEGHLIGEPVRAYHSTYPWAVSAMEQIIRDGQLRASAVLCTTEAGAIGAARAMANRRIAIGKEVSLCCTNEEGLARYFIPTLTTLETHDPAPFLQHCLEWMIGEITWTGPKCLEPKSANLLIGESTGRA